MDRKFITRYQNDQACQDVEAFSLLHATMMKEGECLHVLKMHNKNAKMKVEKNSLENTLKSFYQH